MKGRHLLGACLVSGLMWAAAFSAFAEGLQGLDVLILPKQNAKMIADEMDYDSAFGVLDIPSAGDYVPNLRTILESGKVVAVRTHLKDFTVYRSGRGTDSQFDTSFVGPRAKKFKNLMDHFPGIKPYCSPALEHDVKDKRTVSKWYEILRRVYPNCTPVCSAFTGFCPDGVLREKHGNTGTADIRSNDGDSLFDSNSVNFRVSGKYLSLGWFPECNGRVSGEKQYPGPPATRINWATRALVRQAVRVMRPMTPAPVVPGCEMIKAPDLFKTNAEYYGKGKDDGRGNKGLFIVHSKYPRIGIDSLFSSSVGCLKYYGPFDGGGYRHYVGHCSGQTPVELMDQLRSEWGLLRAGSKCWVFNAIRRMGYYR